MRNLKTAAIALGVIGIFSVLILPSIAQIQVIRERIQEGSDSFFMVGFRNQLRVRATPKTVCYYVHDEATQQQLYNNCVVPAPEVELRIPPEGNRILNENPSSEAHVVTVLWTYGLAGQLSGSKKFRYFVENNTKIQVVESTVTAGDFFPQIISLPIATPIVASVIPGLPDPPFGCTYSSFSIAAGGDDGIVGVTGDADWPVDDAPVATVGGTEIDALKLIAGTFSDILMMFRWDTGATIAAGSTIMEAYLDVVFDDIGLFGVVYGSTDSLELNAEWYTSWPIDVADFTTSVGTDALDASGNCGSNCTPPTFPNGFAANDTLRFHLDGAAANVSDTTYSGLRVGMELGGTPTGANLLVIKAFEDSAAVSAKLIVLWCAP